MTKDLIKDSGSFRRGNEAVFGGDQIIFVAPPPENVPILINDLFSWMKKEKSINILILSSIFHYEFVFIHSFSDGNGRTARLWQTALLTKQYDIFQYLPIENQIEKNQQGYYDAISRLHIEGKSNAFIEFMLRQIDDVLNILLQQIDESNLHISDYVNKLLNVMKDGVPYSTNYLMNRVGIKTIDSFRKKYLRPALDNGLIRMTIPDKPTNKNQKYY